LSAKYKKKKEEEKINLFFFSLAKEIFTYSMRMSLFVKIFISSSAINVFGKRTRELSSFFVIVIYEKVDSWEEQKNYCMFYNKKKAKEYLSVRFLSTVNGSIECLSNKG